MNRPVRKTLLAAALGLASAACWVPPLDTKTPTASSTASTSTTSAGNGTTSAGNGTVGTSGTTGVGTTTSATGDVGTTTGPATTGSNCSGAPHCGACERQVPAGECWVCQPDASIPGCGANTGTTGQGGTVGTSGTTGNCDTAAAASTGGNGGSCSLQYMSCDSHTVSCDATTCTCTDSDGTTYTVPASSPNDCNAGWTDCGFGAPPFGGGIGTTSAGNGTTGTMGTSSAGTSAGNGSTGTVGTTSAGTSAGNGSTTGSACGWDGAACGSDADCCAGFICGPGSCVYPGGTGSTGNGGTSTPLVFVFDGAPVAYADAPGRFELARPGSGLTTDWPTARTPWLALDRDGSGAIEDGRELFGSMTVLPDGRTALNGFQALAALDSNRDGVLDARDPAFARLALWADRDADRRSAPGELTSLAAARIVSIELGYTLAERCDARGNCERERAAFTWAGADGMLRRGEVVDVHLRNRPVALAARR